MLFGTVSFGEFAVDAFFILSGYLIVESWMRKPDAPRFLKNRILRIYPGFIAASILCAVIVGPLGANPAKYFANFDCLAFAKNALLLQIPSVPAVFAGWPYAVVNGSLWTISLEFTCYLVVLAAGVSGLLRRRYAWLALSLVVVGAFFIMKAVNFDVPPIYRLAAFFFSGGCLYLYRDMIRMDGRIAFVLFCLLAVAMFSWRGAEPALTTAGSYALIYLATKRSAFLSRFNLLPDISYGIYLYAWPVQKLLIWYVPGISPWALAVAAGFISMLLGYASWRLVEKPMLKFKDVPPSQSAAEAAKATA